VLLVHIFEPGVDVLQKNILLYKLPTKGKFFIFLKGSKNVRWGASGTLSELRQALGIKVKDFHTK
jgi:hypothetical protein